MKKKHIFIIALLSLSLVGCQAKELPMEAPTALAVEAMMVKRSEISNQFSYSGKIKPIEEANVMSIIGGKINSVSRDVGSVVNKGDVLFQMDTTDILNSINELNASLAAADAAIASAQTGINIANGANMQSQIDGANAAVINSSIAVEGAELAFSNAQLAYDNAKTTYDSSKQLFDVGAIAKTDMDKIQLAYDNANIALTQADQGRQKAAEAQRQADQSLILISQEMPKENAQRAQDAYNSAVASRGATAARMASAQKSLSDATVVSPISGTVTAKNVVAGTVISQSQPAFTIANMFNVEVAVGVSEQVINSLQTGATVQVRVSTLSDEMFTGTINGINPAASATGTYDVKIVLENRKGLLKPGMLAEVFFTREFAPSSIVVPRSAVITKNDENYVYIVQNDTVSKVPVSTGIDNGNSIEILSGLTEGMNLISKGQTFVAEGDLVNIVRQDGEDTTPNEELPEVVVHQDGEDTTPNEELPETDQKTSTNDEAKGE